jgi:NAD(P)-dependent dehydrogenase (short-subunit alcohol dehydrogenase family)
MAGLAGRHALVTGASRGIGAAIARRLLDEGAAVTLLARTKPSLQGLSGRTFAVAADVRDETAVTVAIGAARTANGPIDILINNAGGAVSAPFARHESQLVRGMLELNLVSVFLLTRLVLPSMVARGWGRVVNVASTAGLKGYPYVSAYCAAKHGVVGLTRALAHETARTGVTVNAVCPGYVDTGMLDAAAQEVAGKTGRDPGDIREGLAAANPGGRLVQPDEVAAAVSYLASAQASAVSGVVLPVAGGEV